MAQTATVEVKINKNHLDEWARQRISELEGEVSKQTKRADRWEKKYKEREAEAKHAANLYAQIKEFARDLMWETDLDEERYS